MREERHCLGLAVDLVKGAGVGGSAVEVDGFDGDGAGGEWEACGLVDYGADSAADFVEKVVGVWVGWEEDLDAAANF